MNEYFITIQRLRAGPSLLLLITCARSMAVGHKALQRTFLMTSGSKLMVIRRMMLSQAGPLDSICMKT